MDYEETETKIRAQHTKNRIVNAIAIKSHRLTLVP